MLLPDTRPVQPADGEPRPLHALPHGQGLTLLVLGGPEAQAGQVVDLAVELHGRSRGEVDAVFGLCTRPGEPRVGRIPEQVAAQLGVVGVTLLGVRPDRYIGLGDDGSDPRAMEAYLDALVS